MKSKLMKSFLTVATFLYSFQVFSLEQKMFNDLVEHFEQSFSQTIFSKTGKQLIIQKNWDNDRVNAHATKDQAGNLVVSIDGGMVRHQYMTPDGLWMIMCHELGHHLGGAPLQMRGNSNLKSWSSVEGQADYYAATKCFPKILLYKSELGEKLDKKMQALLQRQNSSNNKEESNKIELNDEQELNHAMKKCKDEECVRIAIAGLAVTRVFASLKEGHVWPELSKEEMFEAYRTNTGHPSPQCRLDTIVSGANCKEGREIDFDLDNPHIGACRDGESGARPLCWYAPTQR